VSVAPGGPQQRPVAQQFAPEAVELRAGVCSCANGVEQLLEPSDRRVADAAAGRAEAVQLVGEELVGGGHHVRPAGDLHGGVRPGAASGL